MSKNKQCPFCGWDVDPAGWLRNDGVQGPECDNCGATATSLEYWNMRVPSHGVRDFILKDRNAVQSVMITQQQWTVLQFISTRTETRSPDIAKRFDLSPQHTSMIASALYQKGYITREVEGAPSGGWQYIFKLNPTRACDE